ncbi:hypothetical protein LCGC14_2816820, partial [marine sediment metagenome]
MTIATERRQALVEALESIKAWSSQLDFGGPEERLREIHRRAKAALKADREAQR